MCIVGEVYLLSVEGDVFLAHRGSYCCVGLQGYGVIMVSGVLTRVGVPVYIHVHGAHIRPFVGPPTCTAAAW